MIKQNLIRLAGEAGAVRTGFASAKGVNRATAEAYLEWLEEGNNGEMDYLSRNCDVRFNPLLLLDKECPPEKGTVISFAFAYSREVPFGEGAVRFARYAVGDDYHVVLRKRLEPLADFIRRETGEEARVCVDTAPILERYWAVKGGVGFIGRNHSLIVPGVGSYVFLAEIVTSAVFEADERCRLSCRGCSACLRKCPLGALSESFDARRCLSYLSIEFRGERLPEEAEGALGDCIYGCDICQEVCPHNRVIRGEEALNEFAPRQGLLNLSREEVLGMDQVSFSRLFKDSAVKRTKLKGLRRNAGFS